MNLRDQVTADVSTFLNVDEFGSEIVIDGRAVACVLVNDEAPTEEDGVSILESLLYVRAGALAPADPVVRQRLTVDGRQANVMKVDAEQGLLVVRLRWWSS